MITHLKERIEFYAMCLEHGEENVEWSQDLPGGGFLPWFSAATTLPEWAGGLRYRSRLRPKTVRIPEAEVPAGDVNGVVCLTILKTYTNKPGSWTVGGERYASDEDFHKAANAMLARKPR